MRVACTHCTPHAAAAYRGDVRHVWRPSFHRGARRSQSGAGLQHVAPDAGAGRVINARASRCLTGLLFSMTADRCACAWQELRWVPSRKPGSARPAAQAEVAALSDICTDLLARHVEDIESLWGLPDAIKVGKALSLLSPYVDAMSYLWNIAIDVFSV